MPSSLISEMNGGNDDWVPPVRASTRRSGLENLTPITARPVLTAGRARGVRQMLLCGMPGLHKSRSAPRSPSTGNDETACCWTSSASEQPRWFSFIMGTRECLREPLLGEVFDVRRDARLPTLPTGAADRKTPDQAPERRPMGQRRSGWSVNPSSAAHRGSTWGSCRWPGSSLSANPHCGHRPRQSSRHNGTKGSSKTIASRIGGSRSMWSLTMKSESSSRPDALGSSTGLAGRSRGDR